ncbi:metal-dependent hydrolase [Rossellomorea vietnamensis]|uniref:Metal-dependent hydrolase n=1 Tax=Rossellomorea vietnamensis TaxID=218284 RepID=A0A5D4K7V4_9BACI|nr:metal-dependent hydrolase [Rossellomorea vietnamensis]TYR73322.1 metal-dependent hydrolase [Rossellomorea vietnamensis]
MNGTAHMVIGSGAGLLAAQHLQAAPEETLLLIGAGGLSGLVPDLDVDGKLRNTFTSSHKFLMSLAQLIGIAVIVYSWWAGTDAEMWRGIAAGLAIMLVSVFIKKRHLLTVAGAGALTGGLFLDENWLWLFGIYIIIASLVSHRSYTHSLLGVAFYAIILYYLQISFQTEGILLAGAGGYMSHLVADMKWLPFNKRGVKLFLPFSRKEI